MPIKNDDLSICLANFERTDFSNLNRYGKGYSFEMFIQRLLDCCNIVFEGNPQNYPYWLSFTNRGFDIKVLTGEKTWIKVECKFILKPIFPSWFDRDWLSRDADIFVTNDISMIPAECIAKAYSLGKMILTPIQLLNYVKGNKYVCLNGSVGTKAEHRLGNKVKCRLGDDQFEVELGVMVKPDLRAESKLDGETIDVARDRGHNKYYSKYLDNTMNNALEENSSNVSVTEDVNKTDIQAEHGLEANEKSKLDEETINVAKSNVEGEISGEVIKEMWLGLAKLPMPRIRCIVKPRDMFEEKKKQLRYARGLIEEFGETEIDGKVVAFRVKLTKPFSRRFKYDYLIVIPKDCDIVSSLIHQLLNIAEDLLLKLQYGELTSLYEKSILDYKK